MGRFLGLVVALAWALSAEGEARADMLADAAGPRAIGTSDALTAASYGAVAKSLNPAGVALMKSYVIEGWYGFRPSGDGQVASAAICDSTRRVGACLSYDFVTASPASGTEQRMHVFSLATGVPISDKIILGFTNRVADYEETVADVMSDASRDWAFIMDAGLIVRITPQINVAAVAHNLVGSDDAQFARSYGGGFAFVPRPELTIAADMRYSMVTEAPRWAGGVEYYLGAGGGQSLYPIRVGYSYDAANDAQYVTGGLGWVSPRLGLDIGARKQVAEGDELTLQFGLRLFMPNAL